MKKVRLIYRSASVVFGVISVGALISSCRKKERTCRCETNVTYTYNYIGSEPVVYNYSYTYVVKEELRKCSRLNKEIFLKGSYGAYTYEGEGTVTCKRN